MVGVDDRTERRAAATLLPLLVAAVGGCYQSYLDHEECAPAPICLDGAVPVCLDELAVSDGSPFDDPACRTIEVTGTDDCASEAGRIHIVRRAEGASGTRVELTVMEVPSGVTLGGDLMPSATPACRPCASGVGYDNPMPGDTYVSDHGGPPGADDHIEMTLRGGGVRYRVVLCAHN
ncbi:MAG: hypothetical protein HY905_19600 [Deltaproteobacteria bacterium]|nr:hypothetical protein [Deltaproteobacteria bacterium]